MPKDGFRSVTMDEVLLNDLKAIWQQKQKSSNRKDYKESTYIQELLSEYIDFNKKLREYGPFIRYVEADGQEIYLVDERNGKTHITVEIRASEKKLYCKTDSKYDCVHVGFCYGIKEIYDVLLNEGFKPPKH